MCHFPPDYMWVLFPDVVMVIVSEVAVDVIKHAFITKFNDIPADVRINPDIAFSEHSFIRQLTNCILLYVYCLF